jgi:hypothetical protein
MKLLFSFFSLLMLFMCSVCDVSAQSVDPSTPPGIPLDGIFATFLTLVAFIPVAVQFLRNVLFKGASGLVMQILSWAIGLVITGVGWGLNIGFLAELSVWQALIYGAGACLAANGVFDTGIVSTIIDGIFKLFKPK